VHSSLSFDHWPGAALDDPRPPMLTEQDGSFTLSPTNAPTPRVSGALPGPGGYPHYTFAFAAPDGAQLAPGAYPDAASDAAPLAGRPGFHVRGSTAGCGRSEGSFVVLESTRPVRSPGWPSTSSRIATASSAPFTAACA
jgi:hypothetical protein